MSNGWSSFFDNQMTEKQKAFVGRIVAEEKKYWKILSLQGEELICRMPGKLRRSFSDAEIPGVGDWIQFSEERLGQNENEVLLISRLNRFSFLKRKAAGETEDQQLLAANIDLAFIVMSMNQDFSERRFERYLTICREGNVTPVLVLSKEDLVTDPSLFLNQVASSAQNIQIFRIRRDQPESFINLKSALLPGQTGVVLGSSGVGKSTLINFFLGLEIQKTFDIRGGDDKGRHTTTSRSLHYLNDGSMVIDTPGLRELQIIADQESLNETFPDIAQLALNCKFADCKHISEPQCAVKTAVQSGQIEENRVSHFKALRDEIQRREKRKRGY